MRILFVCNKVPYPPKDGGAIATFNMLNGLSAAGAECHCLAMSTPKHPVSLSSIPEEVKVNIGFDIVDVDTTIRLTRLVLNLMLSKIPYNAERFINRAFSSRLQSLLSKQNFDIIQLEGLYLVPYIPLIRRFSKAKISFRAHNIEGEIWERAAEQMKNPIKKWYLKVLAKRIDRLEKEYLAEYDCMVPISERDENIFLSMGYNKPSITIQSGFDFSHIQKVELSTKPIKSVFHLGGLDWIPNQEGLQWFVDEVWPELCKKYPDLRFKVAGRNASEAMKKKLDREGVDFIGEVDDAYAFMENEGIMIVPLFSGSGMRIKLVEGMALGKNIISTLIGAEGIPVEYKKHLMLANTKEEFIRSFEYLLANKEAALEQRKGARNLIYGKFDNFALTQKLIEFYKELLG